MRLAREVLAKEYYHASSFSDDVYVVARIASQEGYDWDEFAVFRQGDDYFYSYDAGCSCNGPFETADENEMDDLTPYTWGKFVDAMTSSIGESVDIPGFLYEISELIPWKPED